MKENDFKTGEKVLVLGAGQLGAAMLDSLVPAVHSAMELSLLSYRPDHGTTRVNCGLKFIKIWLMQGQHSSLSMSLKVQLKR